MRRRSKALPGRSRTHPVHISHRKRPHLMPAGRGKPDRCRFTRHESAPHCLRAARFRATVTNRPCCRWCPAPATRQPRRRGPCRWRISPDNLFDSALRRSAPAHTSRPATDALSLWERAGLRAGAQGLPRVPPVVCPPVHIGYPNALADKPPVAPETHVPVAPIFIVVDAAQPHETLPRNHPQRGLLFRFPLGRSGGTESRFRWARVYPPLPSRRQQHHAGILETLIAGFERHAHHPPAL